MNARVDIDLLDVAAGAIQARVSAIEWADVQEGLQARGNAVIKRLLESELIEELRERPDPAHDDERRRYYRLTPLGRRVAESEAARLTRLLADARASGLVPRKR